MSSTLRNALQDLPGDSLVPVSWIRELLANEDPRAETGDLTVAEVADRFDRTEATVRGWCRDGLLPGAYKVRRAWFIPPSSLRSLCESHTQEGDQDNIRPLRRRPASRGPAPDLSKWRQHRRARRAP